MAQHVTTHEQRIQNDAVDDTNIAERQQKRGRDTDVNLTMFQRLIYTLSVILNGLLFIRFLFVLLGANASNNMASFIYSVTAPFVAPFRGIFSINYEAGLARFEVETLLAIVFYSLLAWAIVRLLSVPKRNDVDPRV